MKYTSMRAARKSLSLLATGALAAGMLTIGSLSPSVSTPAQAAPALDCAAIYSIQGTGNRNLWQVGTATGAQTSVGTADIPNTTQTQNLNGLGISRDGSAAFGVLPNSTGTGRTIYRIDRATEQTVALGAGENGTPVTHGAINPATGLYYYGGFDSVTNALEVYGFDVTTGASLGLVATGSIPQAGRNGDWVFDQQGNLYVIGGGDVESILSVVDQAIPAVGGAPVTITGTQLADIVTPDPVNGIAISSDGLLYLGSGSALRAVDPVTGDVVRTVPLTQAGSVDFASCATPSTVTLQKNFPNGRAVEGEQVTLSLAGGGLPAGLEDTTEGNDPGVQNQPSEVVGPVFGRTGATYTITETGAGARPSSPTAAGYTSTWSCIDQNTTTVIASGTGTTGSFTMPNGGATGIAALCTFTNTPELAALTLDKVAAPASGNTVGSTVTYSFVVTNTGTVPLENVTVADSRLTGPVTCPAGPLAVGASVTCEAAPYVLTQADVDAGQVTNKAIATGTTPNLPPATDEDTETTSITGAPKLEIIKSASTDKITRVGQNIEYSFELTNTGNVTLTDVTAVDDKTRFTGSGELSPVLCPEAARSLAPGKSVTCSATYTVTQADLDSAELRNIATGTATDPRRTTVGTAPSEVAIPTEQQPALAMVKSADAAAMENIAAGQKVRYSFAVSNTGNVTLENVTVTDDSAKFTGDATQLSDITCPESAASLAPNESVTCIATYTVTQADVDRGTVKNTATATAIDRTKTPVTTSPSDVTIPSDAAPAIDLEKAASTETITRAGQEITYSFVVKNTGNMTLKNVRVIDDVEKFSGSGKLSDVTCPDSASTLAPGATVICFASYTATQGDVDAGVITNVATATGTPLRGSSPVSEPSDATVTAPASPSLSVVKSASTETITEAGQEITYSFLIENTGNVTLKDVTAVDDKARFSGTGELSAITCPEPADSLAPGATVTCFATYTATQADIDKGVITNVATATGTPTRGTLPPSNESAAKVTAPAAPALSLVKSASVDEVTRAGQQIEYSFELTNTGNVTLENVTAIDDAARFTGSGDLSPVVCPEAAASLAPAASVTCIATYTVTQEDIDAGTGTIENIASGTGNDPAKKPVTTEPSEAIVTVPAQTGISLVKSADADALEDIKVGQKVTYSFLVKNTGNVTLNDVTINEESFTGDRTQLSDVACGSGAVALAPGAEVLCTASYTVVQADVDAKGVSNVATATGTPSRGTTPVSTPSEAKVPAAAEPSLALVKTASADKATAAGQEIEYSFLLTNTGNVSLTDVTAVEGEFSGAGDLSDVVCPETLVPLVPGASVTCTATYTTVAADLTGTDITNTATGTGTVPGEDPVTSDPSTAKVATEAPVVIAPEEPAAPAKGKLAYTGSTAGQIALGGLAVLLLGAGAVAASRVRRRGNA